MGHRNEPNYKKGAWWQNLRLVHNSALLYGIFDTYVDPGSVFISKFKFSITGAPVAFKTWCEH